MRCETCQGRGWRFSLPPGANAFEMRLPALANAMQRVPCNECGGSGIAHCCDGDRANPGTGESEGER
jgi:hypothetical protein